MYDSFLNISRQEIEDKQDESSDEFINIDVPSAKKDVTAPEPEILACKHGMYFWFIQNGWYPKVFK